MDDLDQEYASVADKLDWDDANRHLEKLRSLVARGHSDSMNLLAILLGDIDSQEHREEIISLYEESYRRGSPVAAKGLSIQYRQWGEIEMSRSWEFRARGRGEF